MSSNYIDYLKNKNKCCKTITGPQGPQGPTGTQGLPGTAVNTGATGPQGLPGVVIQYVYKNTNFSDNLKLTRTSSNPFFPLVVTGYSCSAEGYTDSIKPSDIKSCIKVQFKIKYKTSDVVGTRLDIGVVYTIDGGATYSLLGQDTLCGTYNAGGPLINTYTLNYMHCPATTSTVTYIMFFNLESTADFSLGILGDNPSTTSNCIILEEYSGVGNSSGGPTGPIGPIGPTGAGGSSSIPTGAIMIFGTSIVPSGWLECDGSDVLISSYTTLYLTPSSFKISK